MAVTNAVELWTGHSELFIGRPDVPESLLPIQGSDRLKEISDLFSRQGGGKHCCKDLIPDVSKRCKFFLRACADRC